MKKHRVTPASAFGKAARELQVKETRTSASPVNRLIDVYKRQLLCGPLYCIHEHFPGKLMRMVCLGLNHRTAPVEIRERFAVPSHSCLLYTSHDLLKGLEEQGLGLGHAAADDDGLRVQEVAAVRCV